MGETPVTVVGTLVTEMRPRRVGPDGSLVLNFRVAGNERRFDKVSESWVNGESLYLPVSCWRQLAENAASLVKGDPVIVVGKLRTREWTTDQGERRSVVEMEASAVGPDLTRCTATVRRQRREEGPANAEPDGTEVREVPDVTEVSDVTEAPPGALRSDDPGLSDLADGARPLVPVLA